MMYGRGDIQQDDSSLNMLKQQLGEDNLDAISPSNLAGRIKVPVLLAAGREDVRAPPEHTEAMARALQQAGKSVEMKIYTGEGHGNYLVVNQIDFANRLLNFLDKHIGPGSQGTKPN
jgi:dipeptidyl aminopeptidase/acylaminoacyl peptidase